MIKLSDIDLPKDPLATYEYHREADGCDDLWVIRCTADEREVVQIPFWDCDAEGMNLSESQAKLLAATPALFNVTVELLKAVERLPRKALTRRLRKAHQTAIAILANTGAH